MKRKDGITFIAVLLGLGCILGLPFDVSNFIYAETTLENTYYFLGIVTSILAGRAAYGLWKLTPWAFSAFITYFVFSVASGFYIPYQEEDRIELFNHFHWIAIVALTFIGYYLWYLIILYVRKNTPMSSSDSVQTESQDS